jgi:hypothetical protein
MSRTRRVPAAVPSLFHNSVPAAVACRDDRRSVGRFEKRAT